MTGSVIDQEQAPDRRRGTERGQARSRPDRRPAAGPAPAGLSIASDLAIGMAHLGVGAFHRCHQGDFTDDMLEARFDRFGIVGINLRPPRLADSLAPQDGLLHADPARRATAPRPA